jgi:hypothetical protein
MWTGIELLLVLQDLRMQFPLLEDVYLCSSSRILFQILPVVIIAAFLWFIDKRQGEIIGLSFITSTALAITIKFGIAQPRPWVLDPRIIQVEGTYASGYSCPSNHTSMVTSSLLPAAYYCRNRIVSILLIVVTAFVVSGRLVLCAHTPLDIIVALVVCAVSIFVSVKLVDYSNRGDTQFYTAWIVHTTVITALIIMSLVAWDADHHSILENTTMFYGMMAGRLLDHIFVRYEVTPLASRSKLKRYVLGMAMGGFLFMLPYLVSKAYGASMGGFLLMFWIFFAYPWVMKRWMAAQRDLWPRKNRG